MRHSSFCSLESTKESQTWQQLLRAGALNSSGLWLANRSSPQGHSLGLLVILDERRKEISVVWRAHCAVPVLSLPSRGSDPQKSCCRYFHLSALQPEVLVCLIAADFLALEQMRTSFAPSQLSLAPHQVSVVFPSVALRITRGCSSLLCRAVVCQGLALLPL